MLSRTLLFGSTIRVGTVVLGQGPSSTAVLDGLKSLGDKPGGASDTRKDVDLSVVRVGQPGFWTKMSSALSMGQSTGTLVPPAQRGGMTPQPFITVGSYNQMNQRRAEVAKSAIGGVADIGGSVTRVKKFAPGEFLVEAMTPDGSYEIIAERVISALGAGPERQLGQPHQPRPSGTLRMGEFTTGGRVLTAEVPMIRGGRVLVVGDGPTAMWAAWDFRMNGNDVFVLGPPTDTAFANANPNGRNSGILRLLAEEGRLIKGVVKGTEGRDVPDGSNWSDPGIYVHIDDCEPFDSRSGGKRMVLPVAQFVTSIGSGADPRAKTFDPAIIGQLEPVLDPGQSATDPVGVALVSPDLDVFVIGAQAISLAAQSGYRSFLGSGRGIGQPNVGIATNERAVRALTEQLFLSKLGAFGEQAPIEVMTDLFRSQDLHPQTARRVEFVSYFVDRGVAPKAAQEMAEQLELERSRHSEFDVERFAEAVTTLAAGRRLVEPGDGTKADNADKGSSAPSSTQRK